MVVGNFRTHREAGCGVQTTLPAIAQMVGSIVVEIAAAGSMSVCEPSRLAVEGIREPGAQAGTNRPGLGRLDVPSPSMTKSAPKLVM